jgi:hypothetical protein
MKALDTTSDETAECILHARNAAINVVRVGPPSRCTMFSVVVAMGISCLGTPLYAAEIDGTPMALYPMPRSSSDITKIGPVIRWFARYKNGNALKKLINAPPAATLRMPKCLVSHPIEG